MLLCWRKQSPKDSIEQRRFDFIRVLLCNRRHRVQVSNRCRVSMQKSDIVRKLSIVILKTNHRLQLYILTMIWRMCSQFAVPEILIRLFMRMRGDFAATGWSSFGFYNTLTYLYKSWVRSQSTQSFYWYCILKFTRKKRNALFALIQTVG